MKTAINILIGLAVVAALSIEPAVPAVAPVEARACGFKPFPPFGCKRSDAVCICDDRGCHWVWICGR